MLRALMKFYNVEIPQHWLPTLALSVETDEPGHLGPGCRTA
jgi:hypothetical protein